MSELPESHLAQWLADFGGDDQWSCGCEQAGVVLGHHIIIWQDEPLTDADMREAVEDYQEGIRGRMEALAEGDMLGDDDVDWN